jgi:electron transfer flavoprotein beta subunit
VRLQSEVKKSAHDRLQAAIAAPSKGGVVVAGGSHVEKAQVVLDYLRKNGLIEL